MINKSIITLEINDNLIKSEGANHISKMLKINASLRSLDLSILYNINRQ